MAAIETGTICFRTAGKNAGEKVVVLVSPKNGIAMVEGMRSKKIKCNIMHLWPTGRKTSLGSTYTKKELKTALEGAE